MDKKFIGSTAALVLSGIMIAGGLSQQSSLLFGGLFALLGTLAYRSAKKRKLKLVEDTKRRRLGELLTLTLMVCMVVFQKNAGQLIFDDPMINLVIPVWTLIAYLVIKPKAKGN